MSRYTKGLATQIDMPPEWVEDANEMDVSRAEYLRRMVRAGRRQWGYDHTREPENPHVQLQEPGTQDTVNVRSMLKHTILRNLSTTDGIDEAELIDLVTGDLEEITDEVLDELKEEGEADYSSRKGGWVKKS